MSQSSSNQTDYSNTLYLPVTDFPMRAGLPDKEPKYLERWEQLNIYKQLREAGKGRNRFVLHDGPPYANANIHIGTALNKILKDITVRSKQMLGWEANYVPGWDCHGLPIEWKIEQQYREKGKNKDEVPIIEFRNQCRHFAEKWLDIQREELKRLGGVGDWSNPYLTMSCSAEAQIARELMKFAVSGQLYLGSKPVMWSPVEKTALAEAEVEYKEKASPTIWVKFPIAQTSDQDLQNVSVVIWTTTPWTIPANRAVAYGEHIQYALYRVTEAAEDNWAKTGDLFVLSDSLAESVFKAARVTSFERIKDVKPQSITRLAHPYRNMEGAEGYWDYDIPMLVADYVTDDTGTGFVHTAPGHGADDYITFLKNKAAFLEYGLEEVPHTVSEDSSYFSFIPVFAGLRIYDEKGKDGPANETVISKLIAANALIARGRLVHQYPHSWRSKAPVIFRNTPQWFIYMDKPLKNNEDTLRNRALQAIKGVRWLPETAENRITGMIANRPDWVVSRQRAWGVPISIFLNKSTNEILVDERVNKSIADAFEKEGADAWYKEGAESRFLEPFEYNPKDFTKVNDILDVWFDSGSTHSFVLEQREDLKTCREKDGGPDIVMYMEGSDQHRGWFHSSLLESCGTRGCAPYDIVATHGFVLNEKGTDKMSKSDGTALSPQKVIKDYGADILRLWVAASDYSDDLRIGNEILKTFAETYRKLRNTLRWMLGSLHYFNEQDRIPYEQMPELEHYILHRLYEMDRDIRNAYEEFDYKRVVALLNTFMTSDLSAFYFDIRKDTLYCDPPSSIARKSALTVIDETFRRICQWLAPILAFSAEEAWLSYFPGQNNSVHLETFAETPQLWNKPSLAAKWQQVRSVRRVVTGALEIERAAKKIGSSLESRPLVYINDPGLWNAILDLDMSEICITSGLELKPGEGPQDAFQLADVKDVWVVNQAPVGKKCARCWKILPDVGQDAEFPDVSLRDAQALRELKQLGVSTA